MPVRSLSSSVITWPDAVEVEEAVRRWAREAAARHPQAVKIGYFGSYATGNWGVGSDVDLIAIVRQADRPFAERALSWNTLDLPVPADLLVYTEDAWASMTKEGRRITEQPIVWVYRRDIERQT